MVNTPLLCPKRDVHASYKPSASMTRAPARGMVSLPNHMGIPHGATITGISARCYDGSSTENMTFTLYNGPATATVIGTCATTAAFNGGWTTVSGTANYTFYYSTSSPTALYVYWNSSGIATMYLYAVTISYTYTSP